jgi:hypothetical protein
LCCSSVQQKNVKRRLCYFLSNIIILHVIKVNMAACCSAFVNGAAASSPSINATASEMLTGRLQLLHKLLMPDAADLTAQKLGIELEIEQLHDACSPQ